MPTPSVRLPKELNKTTQKWKPKLITSSSPAGFAQTWKIIEFDLCPGKLEFLETSRFSPKIRYSSLKNKNAAFIVYLSTLRPLVPAFITLIKNGTAKSSATVIRFAISSVKFQPPEMKKDSEGEMCL